MMHQTVSTSEFSKTQTAFGVSVEFSKSGRSFIPEPFITQKLLKL